FSMLDIPRCWSAYFSFPPTFGRKGSGPLQCLTTVTRRKFPMRHLLFGAALLLAIAPAAIAQNDKDKPKPDKPSATAEKELKDLNDEFNKAQNDLYKSLNDAKTPEEAQKIAEKEKLAEKQQKLMADYAKRAFVIAEKYPKEGDVAVDAL